MDKYKYTYEKTANYCYKNSDVLINLLNITNEQDLYEAERELVMYRISALNDNPIAGSFDFCHLKNIHHFLFQDVYRWAGEIRNCNIAKKDLFCLSQYIETYGKEIFDNLKNEKYYIEYPNGKKIEKLVQLFADINALHPFREGNGRSQRTFIEMLAKINGINLDLTSVSKENMIIASHESLNGNNEKLLHMFKSNSRYLTQEEQKRNIDIYCSQELKDIIK